jgi:hypothetical protein
VADAREEAEEVDEELAVWRQAEGEAYGEPVED